MIRYFRNRRARHKGLILKTLDSCLPGGLSTTPLAQRAGLRVGRVRALLHKMEFIDGTVTSDFGPFIEYSYPRRRIYYIKKKKGGHDAAST